MKKLLVLTLMFVVWATADSPATAALNLATVDGAWSNPVGGVGITYNDGVAVAYGNTLQDQIRWGTPYHQPNQSGLGFTGAVGGSVGPLSVTENVAFSVGQLAHFNYEIATGSNATAVDLGITLTFSSPAISGTFTFTFNINETPGIGTNDFIHFPYSISNETFTLDGREYVLELLGFGTSPSDLQTQFQSIEGGTNSTMLWARVTSTSTDVVLSITSTAGGDVTTPGEGIFTYGYGTSVPVVATPYLHHHFVNWTGTAVTAGKVADPTAASTTVTMEGNYTLVANFAIDQVTLTPSSTAGGDVTTPGEGTFTYGYGTSVPVVATADIHYHFLNWSGTAVTAGKVADPTAASTTVTMDGNYTLVANFASDQVTLTPSSTAGGDVTTPGEGTFTYGYGTSVPVVATQDLHYHFVNWTGTAVTAGKVADPTAASTTVTMEGNYTLVANFASDQVTLTPSSTAGGDVTTPGEGTFTYGYGTSVPVVATADIHYHFLNWSGTAVTAGKVADPTAASTTVTMEGNYTLVANFAIDKVTLTTSSGAGGAVTTPGEGSFTYDYGTSVPVVATPDLHYHFVNWTGTAVTAGKVADPTAASTTVTMDGDYTLVANFAIGQVTLTTSSGAGGAVTTPGEGSFTYDCGTLVPVVATADLCYHFVNWTGTAVTAGKVADPTAASTTVTMDGDYTLVANFAIGQVTLTTSSGDGGAVTTPGEGSFTYDCGTLVPVVATADLCYHFVNWTGTAVTAGKVADPTSASTAVTMDGDYTLVANFAIGQVTLTTSSGDGGAVTTPGEGSFTYDCGTLVPVVATADLCYHFVNWTGTAVTAGKVADPTSASTAVTMDGDYTLVANFAIGQVTLTTSSGDGGAVTTPGEGSFTYDCGTLVPVVATADLCYHFVNWTGTAVTAGKVADPTSASTAVTMDGDYTLVANFAIGQVTLTMSSGDGGAVTTPGEGSFTYDCGTLVPVVATADLCYHFVNWTGTAVTAGKVADPTSASTAVTMDGDYTLVANFAGGQVTLTVTSTKGGTVLQPGLGTFTYDYDTVVSLEAVPEPGYTWAGWSGSLWSPVALESLTMTGDFVVQANFTSLLCELYVDDNAPADPGPGDNTVSDPCENGSPEHPFDSIQEAIDVAGECARVIVREGTYWEQIDFLNKAITVTGFDPSGPQPGSYPIIDGAGVGPVVKIAICCPYTDDLNSAMNCVNEGPQPVLMGFVITGGNGYYASAIACRNRSPLISNCVIVGNRSRLARSGAIYCENSAPKLVQCTISGNVAGDEGAAIIGIKSSPVLVNSIVWDNVPGQMAFDDKSLPAVSYMDVQGGWPGTGNLDADPLFVLPGYWADPADLAQPIDPRVKTAVWVPGDYHLMSIVGRWDFGQGIWVQDSMTSPCIDAGNPLSLVLDEPVPNGNRVNMGAYGGTSQASLSQ